MTPDHHVGKAKISTPVQLRAECTLVIAGHEASMRLLYTPLFAVYRETAVASGVV